MPNAARIVAGDSRVYDAKVNPEPEHWSLPYFRGGACDIVVLSSRVRVQFGSRVTCEKVATVGITTERDLSRPTPIQHPIGKGSSRRQTVSPFTRWLQNV